MVATTRWVLYPIDAEGDIGTGNGADCRGTQGYSIAEASSGDSFTVGSTTDRLYLSIDGEAAPYITLTSGTLLDPRFVARDITEKLHDLGKSTEAWNNAKCVWLNTQDRSGAFKIISGTLGSASSVVVTQSGTNSVAATLGWSNKTENGGTTAPAHSNPYVFTGDVTVSGTYYGFFDETYTIVMSNDSFVGSPTAPRGIKAPTKDAANSYTGTISTGGVFNAATDITYVIAIDVTNGTTMGAGTGNVPTMTWSSTSDDDSTISVELLYPNHWYFVGEWGVMVKFTDAVFNTCSPAWTIECYKPDYVYGANAQAVCGLAQYVWGSDRGDDSATPITTQSGSFTQLGARGLTIRFNPVGVDNFTAGDEFRVICAGPAPTSYNISSINYGNVTVSTESPVKALLFEIMSGAVEMSTVKFGLNSHGSFSHHYAGNNDTFFRFGTVGPANNGGVAPTDGIEWVPNLLAADIDSDTPPNYLYSTKANLTVVSTADDSQAVGSYGLTSDPIWVNIKLGVAETGANSTILNRVFFDYT